MINANKEKLSSFFQGTIQYEVPFFQRSYVWDEENWTTLWEHVVTVLERHQQGLPSEHFIGTIITKQKPAEQIGQQVHELIDGQQRLTTIALLLQAIGDTATGAMPRLKEVVSDSLRFRDARNKSHPRIIPGNLDKAHYDTIMCAPAPAAELDEEHRLVRAYRFFRDKLKEMPDEALDLLRLVLLERVSVISMLLSAEDDEQEIFDTINALGVRLTTAELLKNYIFKEKSIQAQYDMLWRSVYEDSDDNVEFWNANKTAGRVIRTNIEVLLYCYLVIRIGGEIRLESLFKEYKRWLEGKTGKERTMFLEELRGYAEIYNAFPSGTDLNQFEYDDWEERFFHVVDNLMITTVLPLVLYVYKYVTGADGRRQILRLLESYLVRRNLCRLTTKNYNLLFIQVIKKLEEHRGDGCQIDAAVLAGIIADFEEDTNRMPTDAEVRAAFSSQPLSNQNAREILFLLTLRQVSDGLSDMPKMSLGNYSVEHMMPVKWEANWSGRELGPQEKLERNRKLRTLGNLTLVTKRLNSKMQNASWSEKRKQLTKYATLPLTVAYLEREVWDEAGIDLRASDLADVALEVWAGIGDTT